MSGELRAAACARIGLAPVPAGTNNDPDDPLFAERIRIPPDCPYVRTARQADRPEPRDPVAGDPDNFEQYAKANADKMQRIAVEGKAAGATRHAFAAGHGEIMVIDEWPDAESFQRFFQSQTEIPRLMQEGGARVPRRSRSTASSIPRTCPDARKP
ncbi:MAG: hypothetical protein ACJ786_18265 [Catenulispora sp.]